MGLQTLNKGLISLGHSYALEVASIELASLELVPVADLDATKVQWDVLMALSHVIGVVTLRLTENETKIINVGTFEESAVSNLGLQVQRDVLVALSHVIGVVALGFSSEKEIEGSDS